MMKNYFLAFKFPKLVTLMVRHVLIQNQKERLQSVARILLEVCMLHFRLSLYHGESVCAVPGTWSD